MADISLTKLKTPTCQDIERDIAWLCDSLGLSQARDTQNMSVQIFKIVLLRGQKKKFTPEMIAKELNIEHQRSLYHIRALIKTGILAREGRYIVLREESMKQIILCLQEDANTIFSRLLAIAADIDESLDLKNRE